VTLNICVTVAFSQVCRSSFGTTTTAFLLSGTAGIGDGDIWAAECAAGGGLGFATRGAGDGAGVTGGEGAEEDGSGDAVLDRPACSLARRFARI
jgi:hypothetical protein